MYNLYIQSSVFIMYMYLYSLSYFDCMPLLFITAVYTSCCTFGSVKLQVYESSFMNTGNKNDSDSDKETDILLKPALCCKVAREAARAKEPVTVWSPCGFECGTEKGERQ